MNSVCEFLKANRYLILPACLPAAGIFLFVFDRTHPQTIVVAAISGGAAGIISFTIFNALRDLISKVRSGFFKTVAPTEVDGSSPEDAAPSQPGDAILVIVLIPLALWWTSNNYSLSWLKPIAAWGGVIIGSIAVLSIGWVLLKSIPRLAWQIAIGIVIGGVALRFLGILH